MIGTRSANPLRASGHRTAHKGRIHDRSRPACRTSKNALAERGPSLHDSLADLANGGFSPVTDKAALNRRISLEDNCASGLEAHDKLPSEARCAEFRAAEHDAAAQFLACLHHMPMRGLLDIPDSELIGIKQTLCTLKAPLGKIPQNGDPLSITSNLHARAKSGSTLARFATTPRILKIAPESNPLTDG